MYNTGPILRPSLLKTFKPSSRLIPMRTSPRAAVRHAAATTGARNSAEVEAVSKVLLEMICSVAVSLKRRCSRKRNRKTSASSHTRWYSSCLTSSRFLSVCAVANHRASRLRVFPSPGFALPKGVALSVVAAAFSSGKLILP